MRSLIVWTTKEEHSMVSTEFRNKLDIISVSLRINGLGKGLMYKLVDCQAQEVLYVGYHRNYRRRKWGQGCRS